MWNIFFFFILISCQRFTVNYLPFRNKLQINGKIFATRKMVVSHGKKIFIIQWICQVYFPVYLHIYIRLNVRIVINASEVNEATKKNYARPVERSECPSKRNKLMAYSMVKNINYHSQARRISFSSRSMNITRGIFFSWNMVNILMIKNSFISFRKILGITIKKQKTQIKYL